MDLTVRTMVFLMHWVTAVGQPMCWSCLQSDDGGELVRVDWLAFLWADLMPTPPLWAVMFTLDSRGPKALRRRPLRFTVALVEWCSLCLHVQLRTYRRRLYNVWSMTCSFLSCPSHHVSQKRRHSDNSLPCIKMTFLNVWASLNSSALPYSTRFFCWLGNPNTDETEICTIRSHLWFLLCFISFKMIGCTVISLHPQAWWERWTGNPNNLVCLLGIAVNIRTLTLGMPSGNRSNASKLSQHLQTKQNKNPQKCTVWNSILHPQSFVWFGLHVLQIWQLFFFPGW